MKVSPDDIFIFVHFSLFYIPQNLTKRNHFPTQTNKVYSVYILKDDFNTQKSYNFKN